MLNFLNTMLVFSIMIYHHLGHGAGPAPTCSDRILRREPSTRRLELFRMSCWVGALGLLAGAAQVTKTVALDFHTERVSKCRKF